VLNAAINDKPHHVSIRAAHGTLGRTGQKRFAPPTSLTQVYLAGFAAYAPSPPPFFFKTCERSAIGASSAGVPIDSAGRCFGGQWVCARVQRGLRAPERLLPGQSHPGDRLHRMPRGSLWCVRQCGAHVSRSTLVLLARRWGVP
jgi:hypothetical protein